MDDFDDEVPVYNRPGFRPQPLSDVEAEDAPAGSATGGLVDYKPQALRPFDPRRTRDGTALHMNSVDSAAEAALASAPTSLQDFVARLEDELHGLRHRVGDLERRHDEELLTELRRTAGPHVAACERLLRERRRGQRRPAGSTGSG